MFAARLKNKYQVDIYTDLGFDVANYCMHLKQIPLSTLTKKSFGGKLMRNENNVYIYIHV